MKRKLAISGGKKVVPEKLKVKMAHNYSGR